ncbi:hypothetical protein [Actinoplanes derwentensis]|uniref:hypothetical protein n=1 Tax=Actinoplanes derwentensis TaxID=113562 RepID=UPI000A7113C4|nr:hypothetical protein [Actinoplanes derwentensis]GID85207.1 hypothetical protein Ade03nite_41310 [Actinoplanes derwentensis]
MRPGLSIDVEVALASDMFTQMRTLHAIQRMRAVNAAYGTDIVPNRSSLPGTRSWAGPGPDGVDSGRTAVGS